MNSSTPYQDSEARQTRLAMRMAAGLSEQANALPHDISERLRVAREQAVLLARESRAATRVQAAAPAVVVVGRHSAALGGGPAWWQRLAIALPLVALLGGLVLINERTVHEQVLAAANIDSVLLADDLPPAAYTDPGFAEYLKTSP